MTKAILGTHDVVMVTLDTLRYDVAQQLFLEGRTPHFASKLPPTGWELRHSPGSFTYAAHAAIFAGFLPTPATPGPHPRRIAVGFPGSETITPETLTFTTPDIVSGFREAGYRTICIGGVGFFNKLSPLGSQFPNLFDESHWSPELGVTDPRSTEHQVNLAIERIQDHNRVFLFINVSALHQPNCHYLPGSTTDTLASHAAALEYVDGELGRLWAYLDEHRDYVALVMSDHGTAYGEDGFHGHRLAHPVVWNVPYAEFQHTRPRR
ncbi:MAG: STM4013/SEN3800 family hydrolase [Fimbriiglobus sp.]